VVRTGAVPGILGRPAAVPINRRSAASRSSPKAALDAPAAAGSARTTTNAPAGKAANRDRIRCRSRRCTRCRTTEPPTARPTTKPTFGCTAVPRPRCTTTEPRPARRPRCTAVAKSSRRVRRAAAGSNVRDPRTSLASGRQFSPALTPPGRNDGAPSTGAHAQPEPVGLRAATVVRLERTLALSHGCPFSRCSVPLAGSQPSGLRSSWVVPCQHRRHRCEGISPDKQTASAKGEGTQECPPVDGRPPEPMRRVATPSKPASGVTVRATRRYIGGACLRGLVVAAPHVWSRVVPDDG
jgi:hypothetical protein